ncbi:MAG: GMC family oxidoreductase N-terminal domain-containing protein [Deinococcota bacterium]
MSNTYDYIIVGSGTAGPVIATRLSEDPNTSVVMLEAGRENSKEGMYYANGVGQMWQGETNWGYSSTPQQGLNGRTIMQPRGKLIGGSAAINVGSWSRGAAANYDSWNLKGWEWDTVLQWYLKIEASDRGANEFRGGSGPMKLETTPKGTYLTQVFKQACIETGIGFTDDLNGEYNEGFDVWQSIFKNGRRHNTVVNYLDHARTRSNLTIETDAFVSKIVIENGVAVAVEYSQDNMTHELQVMNTV